MNKFTSIIALAALVTAACGLAPVPTPTPTQPASTPTPLPPTATPIPPTATAPLASPTPEATATETSLFPPVADADWEIGPARARVTIVEYGDYQ